MEGGFIGRCDRTVDEICNAAGHRQTEKQCLGAVQQALVVHHPAKALLRHAHRFQHGKLPAAQAAAEPAEDALTEAQTVMPTIKVTATVDATYQIMR